MHRRLTRLFGRARTRAAVPAALLLVAGVVAGTVAAGPSGAAPPAAGVQTTLVLTPLTTGNTDALGAPPGAAPAVLAQKGVTPILTTLKVSDGSELSKGTVVLLQAVHGGPGSETSAAGTFSPSSFTVPTRLLLLD